MNQLLIVSVIAAISMVQVSAVCWTPLSTATIFMHKSNEDFSCQKKMFTVEQYLNSVLSQCNSADAMQIVSTLREPVKALAESGCLSASSFFPGCSGAISCLDKIESYLSQGTPFSCSDDSCSAASKFNTASSCVNAARKAGCSYAGMLQSTLDNAANRLFHGPFCLTSDSVIETVTGSQCQEYTEQRSSDGVSRTVTLSGSNVLDTNLCEVTTSSDATCVN